MNKSLQVLSAIALIVVIAATSLFGYNQYRVAQQFALAPTSTVESFVTPEPSSTMPPTPLSQCLKHQHSVNIKVSLSADEKNMILQSNSENLELTVKGIGQCIYGDAKQVEAGKEFKINGIVYQKYYEFVIPMREDRAASQGIYVEKGVTFFEYGDHLGPAQQNYLPGQYWVLMQYKATPTATPKP